MAPSQKGARGRARGAVLAQISQKGVPRASKAAKREANAEEAAAEAELL